jgi:gluconokinase
MSTAASQQRSEPIYVVMGVSGCGKTSIGEAVAADLGFEFIEGDALHPPANVEKMARGIPLNDEDRFPWLDRIGARIAEVDGHGLVVSCSSLKKTYRDRLRSFANEPLTFIFLKGSEELLTERMARRKGHFMPLSLLKSQLATLEDPSGEPGVITVDISGTSQDVIERTLKAIAR